MPWKMTTQLEDTFPSKASSPGGCVGAGPGLTQSQGLCRNHSWMWDLHTSTVPGTTLHLLLVLEKGKHPWSIMDAAVCDKKPSVIDVADAELALHTVQLEQLQH